MDRTNEPLREAHRRLREVISTLEGVEVSLFDASYDRPQSTESRTRGGVEISYRYPENSEILWVDLGAGMKKLRYAGQLSSTWTIGHHLALCGRLAVGSTRLRALAVAHDLHEAYVMDIPRGLKECLGVAYTSIESAWEEHIHRELGLWPIGLSDRLAVQRLDSRALAVEMALLGWSGWPPAQRVLDATGGSVSTEEAEAFRIVVGSADPFQEIRAALVAYAPGRIR